MPVCIYCKNAAGPFTKEHVFPYSLGGGEWVLQNLVCANCNNIFSPLERELAHNSPEGMARTAFGPIGRHEVLSGRETPIHAKDHFYISPDSELLIEGGVEKGFKPYTYPQIIESKEKNGTVQVNGSNREEVKKLFEHIKIWYESPEKAITGGRIENNGKQFSILYLTPTADDPYKFDIRDSRTLPRPEGISLQLYTGEPPAGKVFTPRIFIDDKGRIIIKARTQDDAIRILSLSIRVFKQGIDYNKLVDAAPTQFDPSPQMHFMMSFNLVSVFRAVAKIGMNVATYLFGKTYISANAYDPLRDFILGKAFNSIEEASRFVNFDDQNNGVLSIFNTPHDKHWLLLSYNHPTLFFGLRLYGTGGYIVRLGDIGIWPSAMEHFKIVTVDYTKRHMQLLSANDIPKFLKMPQNINRPKS